MSDIPEDIMKTAIDWLTKPVADQYGNHLSYFTGSRYSDHASRIISLAIMAERERAAKIAEEYSAMEHAAHDMKSKSFPTKSPVQDFIAHSIRTQQEQSK